MREHEEFDREIEREPVKRRVLTEEADNDRAEFTRTVGDQGCSCFQAAPCGFCTHPGNPRNQEEDDDCWTEE